MLDEIYNLDDSLTEDSYYDALLYLLGDAHPDLSEEELEDILADILDDLPDHYAEDVLNTVGTLGKKFGKGTMQFAAKNPALVKGAFTAIGSLGGPVGMKVGNILGDKLTKTAQKKTMPETGKVLKMAQNADFQTALTRTSIGVGNGTAPLTINGNAATLTTTAIYLRAMNALIVAALKEMDRHNVIPPTAFSESLPFAEDVDRQAEWLAEQLLRTSNRPIRQKELKLLFSKANLIETLRLLYELKGESRNTTITIEPSNIKDAIKTTKGLEFLKNQMKDIDDIKIITIENGTIKVALKDGVKDIQLSLPNTSIELKEHAHIDISQLKVKKIPPTEKALMAYDISGKMGISGVKVGGIIEFSPNILSFKSEIEPSQDRTFEILMTKVDIKLKESYMPDMNNQYVGFQIYRFIKTTVK